MRDSKCFALSDTQIDFRFSIDVCVLMQCRTGYNGATPGMDRIVAPGNLNTGWLCCGDLN
jgi:hypothetical protein